MAGQGTAGSIITLDVISVFRSIRGTGPYGVKLMLSAKARRKAMSVRAVRAMEFSSVESLDGLTHVSAIQFRDSG
jgi:hypothetical protein